MTPEYFPSWLPLASRPWRLVDRHSGSFYPRPLKAEAAHAFKTAEDALAFARKHGVKLAGSLMEGEK